MKVGSKENWEIIAIMVSSPIIIALVLWTSFDLINLVLSSIFILFFPGYILVSSLFVKDNELDVVERGTYAFLFSMIVSGFVGLVLNFTSYGISLTPILVVLLFFNESMSVVTIYRRNKIYWATTRSPVEILRDRYRSFKNKGKVDQIISFLMVLSLISVALVLTYVIIVPKQQESFSDFYIAGATNSSIDLNAGQNATITLGISDHENKVVTYTIEIYLINMTVGDNSTKIQHMYYLDTLAVTLDNQVVQAGSNWTSQWETQYSFNCSLPGTYKLWLILFKDTPPALPFTPVRFDDLVNTTAVQRVTDSVSNKFQFLNLTVVIKG